MKATNIIKKSCPECICGYPSASPYVNRGEGNYLLFGPAIMNECEDRQIFPDIESAYKKFKSVVKKYVKGKKRMIVRLWPEIEMVKFDKNSNPFFRISCRLLADDGMRELKILGNGEAE